MTNPICCCVHMLLTFAFALAGTALAADGGTPPQPKPFANGDPAIGGKLNDKDCVGCHASRFGGDADRIYLRSDRKVNTPAQLLAQIGRCNAELKTGYFPEEEEHVAAYLNVHYYKFKP